MAAQYSLFSCVVNPDWNFFSTVAARPLTQLTTACLSSAMCVWINNASTSWSRSCCLSSSPLSVHVKWITPKVFSVTSPHFMLDGQIEMWFLPGNSPLMLCSWCVLWGVTERPNYLWRQSHEGSIAALCFSIPPVCLMSPTKMWPLPALFTFNTKWNRGQQPLGLFTLQLERVSPLGSVLFCLVLHFWDDDWFGCNSLSGPDPDYAQRCLGPRRP